MIQLYRQIEKQQDLRETLIEIKAKLKDEEQKEKLQSLYEDHPQALLCCLSVEEDPKVRRNAALILGKLEGKEIPEKIWAAYEREHQRFVRADYLKALESFDCRPYLKELKQQSRKLEEALAGKKEEQETKGIVCPKLQENTETAKSTEKHLRQELKALRKILLKLEQPGRHPFAGLGHAWDVMLFTNRGCETLLADQIQTGHTRLFPGGTLVEQADVEQLLQIRTWRELLFCLKGSRKLELEKAAEGILQMDIRKLLGELLAGTPPYYFRVELKSRMDLSRRSSLCQSLATALEELSGGLLVNAPSAYELTFRFTENKDGSLYPLLKLQALPDHRFAYRRKAVAASMAPVQAAICMELAAGYLKEQAQVLDPFCGVGTMLLERNYKLHANTLYGIDLYAPAIAGARENAQAAGVPVHFVNRDCLTFTHGYLFDEIVTNFPVKGRTKDAHAIDCLYGQFLDKARELLKPDGMILLYSHDRGYVRKHLRSRPEWKLKKEWCVSEKEGAYLFCIGKT